MANISRAAVLTVWRSGADGLGAQLPDLVTLRAGDSVTVIVPDVVAGAAGVALVEFLGQAATLSEIADLPGALVLATEVYDDDTGARLSGNYDSAPTAGQLAALGNQVQARFPALDPARLQEGGRAVLRSGRTRRELLGALARRLKDRLEENEEARERE